MKILVAASLITTLLIGCSKPDAQRIVDRSIAFHGMEKLKNAIVEFDFRSYHFKITQQAGKYTYERFSTDSTGNSIHDILTNDGFTRKINNEKVELTDKEIDKYTEGVNSVVYFFYLPYKLNDEAVNKKLLGQVKIGENEYYKLEISFGQEKGGKDYDDVFYYWFDAKDYSMDHFAYSTGGNRFRAVSGKQNIDGTIFQDYVNYKQPEGDSITPLIKYDSLYQEGKLTKLSDIQFSNITVTKLP